MSDSPYILLDHSSSAVVAHFADKLGISRVKARLFLEELHAIAVSGETEGLQLAGSPADELEALEGTVVMLSETEEGILDPFRDVMNQHPVDATQEEILISNLTGLKIEEIRSLGGLPPQKEKPFKTGFNA